MLIARRPLATSRAGKAEIATATARAATVTVAAVAATAAVGIANYRRTSVVALVAGMA